MVQLREYALVEFWEIFVDDRPFCRDACSKHANVQSKAVFSYAMTVTDEIYEWEDEEKRVGSKFEACMWNPPQRGADKRGNTHSRNGRVLEMLCMNWVSAGTFDDHEWASESTITQHVEEVMGMELDYEIGIPCVVQWCMPWCSAAKRLKRT